jgi:hypothetical protein
MFPGMRIKKPALVFGFPLAAGFTLCLFFASCAKDKSTEASDVMSHASSTAAVNPGEAGGVFEDTYTASAVVRHVDPISRKVILEDSAGHSSSFTAPAEMRNLPQLRPGDRVTATFTERMTVIVGKDSVGGDAYTASASVAPPGAKPGAMYAEQFEAAAKVKSIDSAKRRATLEFADGKTQQVPVRADVDLSKYKAGDTVLIRVTDTLSVLAQHP